MIERRWIRAEVDDAVVAQLLSAGTVDEPTARLLVARGIHTAEDADRYLNPRLTDLPDPSLLKDLDKSAIRIADAIERNEKVALYGDYDVDGVTSTTLLAAFLRSEGLETRRYIPKRLTEGYGLNPQAVETLAGEGIELLITLDCGITAADEIARANEHGIQTIVVDHHRCPPKLPAAFATLNAQQEDCTYPDKGLAAVGACFNLVVGLRRELRKRGRYEGREQPNLRRYLDLVALGTIADMVPLSGVNRILSWYGVLELRAARRPGLRALMEVSRIRAARCTSTDVGFRLGPRINAAGRLSDASVGVQLLLADTIEEARPHAATLDAANAQRQRIEADVFDAAVTQIDEAGGPEDAIVLYDEAWHPGVVGIVASKLVERYERPTIIIGEGGRGSGRTAQGLHLYNAINDCREHLMKFGGHRAAAGMTMASSKFLIFKRAFIERIRKMQPDDGHVPTLTYDDDLEPGQFNREFATALDRLQPFGNGNPQPLFRTKQVSVKHAKIVGHDHLKLRLREGAYGGVEAIAFKRGEMQKDLYPGCKLDVAYHLERSEFSGLEYLQLRIRDLKLEPDVGPVS